MAFVTVVHLARKSPKRPWRPARTTVLHSARGSGLYRRNKEEMSPEDYMTWRQEIRERSKKIPLVVDDDPVEVVYEDEDLLAVSKPSGLKMHPSHRFLGGTLLNRVIGYLGSPPLLLHRLDQSTSGIVLMCKQKGKAVSNLSKSFRDKEVQKDYLALVDDGAGMSSAGLQEQTVDAPIARDADDLFRRKVSWTEPDSKPSQTLITPLRRGKRASLVMASPLTGRTHQIRLHLAHIGHPIVGDPAYGFHGPWAMADDAKARGQLCLHAWRLHFLHPITEQPMVIAAPLPREFRASATFCGVDPADLSEENHWPS